MTLRSSATMRTNRSTSSACSRTNSDNFAIWVSRCSNRLSASLPWSTLGVLTGFCFTSDVTSTSRFMLAPLLECSRIFSDSLQRSIVSDSSDVNESLSFYFHTVLLQSAAMHNIFTMVLAGGKGERLQPLTEHRAKPAVPFGGQYRIIDFTLSNCLNSGLRKVAILIQYKSHSLDRHIRMGWNIRDAELGEHLAPVPRQQRISEEWYQGTADAVYQNLLLLDTEQPEYALILAGDHVYKMNYAEMFNWLFAKGADVVVAAIDIPIKDADTFRMIEETQV